MRSRTVTRSCCEATTVRTSLVDRGSTNGTSVNVGTDVIPLGTLVPLRDGDRIYLGAWTTITIRARRELTRSQLASNV